VTVISDETTHGSDLRGSSLSVLETIAPSETVLDPITEDDDPDVYHWGWRDQMAAARKAGNPFRTLCGKFVYERRLPYRKPCRTCADIARAQRDRKGRD
jgi:hypothetical protein